MLQSLVEPLLGTRRYALATPALCAYGTRIAGTYENGTVQLMEIPSNIRSSKVIVTFLDSVDANSTNQFITLCMFSGTQQSTAEDFKIAEFQGDLDNSFNWS